MKVGAAGAASPTRVVVVAGHQTAKYLLWPQQIAFWTAKATRFAVETANSKSDPTMLLSLQQCV
jgi:hypothetical protein